MPPSGLRQVWFLRRSREPHINRVRCMLPGLRGIKFGSFPRVKLLSSDARWHYGQPMNINHLGICGIENISYSLSFRSRPM
jgi:hypothetical protein